MGRVVARVLLQGVELTYPLGIADCGDYAGRPFGIEVWGKIPQLVFMGENDDTDSVLFDDAYSPSEKEIIRRVIGERMLPDRWEKCAAIYQRMAPVVTIKTYEGVGRGTDQRINAEIVEFIQAAVGLARVE